VLHKDAKVEAIKRVPLFERLPRRSLQEVAQLADEIDLPEGKELARQGDRAREFFVLLKGSASVTQDGAEIATLSDGDFFGEIGLVTNLPRTATVTTTSPARALVITEHAFAALLHNSPEVSRGIAHALGERFAAPVE
jgi:CRP-like cAMP-binding protein